MMKFLFLALLPLVSCKMMDNAEKAANNSEKAAFTTEALSYMSQSGGSEDQVKKAMVEVNEWEKFDMKARTMAAFLKSLHNQVSTEVYKTRFINYKDFYYAKLVDDIKTVRRLATEFMPEDGKFHVTNTKGNHGNIKALAAALHEKNPWCEHVSDSIKPIACKSMLDHIHDAFEAHYIQGIPQEDLPVHQKVVFRYEGQKVFLYMLELRVKFLPLIGIAHVSRVKEGLVNKIKTLLTDWVPDFFGADLITKEARESQLLLDGLFKEQNTIKQELAEVNSELIRIGEQGYEPNIRRKLRRLESIDYQIDEANVYLGIYQNESAKINDEISLLNEKKMNATFKKESFENQRDKYLAKLESLEDNLERFGDKMSQDLLAMDNGEEVSFKKKMKNSQKILRLNLKKRDLEEDIKEYQDYVEQTEEVYVPESSYLKLANVERGLREQESLLTRLEDQRKTLLEGSILNMPDRKKLTEKLDKLRVKVNKAHIHNQEMVKKTVAKVEDNESKELGKLAHSAADIDYFGIVTGYVVQEREFLRGIKVNRGYGIYNVEVPLRNANLSPIVLKILKNLDFQKLRQAKDFELESAHIERKNLDLFEETVKDLIENARYSEMKKSL